MKNRFYHTKESVSEYIKQAEGFNGKEIITLLIKYLKPDSSILELGSGPGTDYKILSEDYSVVGSDFSNEFLKVLNKRFPMGEFLQLDAITIKTIKKFDCLYSNKVLQHLSDSDLKKSILAQSKVLNPNGIICHSFWKGEGDETFKGMLVNYQTKKSLINLFQEKFEILVLENYAEFEENDSVFVIAQRI